MTWIKENWLAVVIAVGIAFSLLLVRSDAVHRAEADRKHAAAALAQTKTDQRKGCERTGVQKALQAAGWLSAAGARRADGNVAKANYYEGIADGTILTIPAPTPALEGARAMAEVQRSFVAGRVRYVLSPAAARLQHAGCLRVYPVH